jgi:hypothetical protein
MENPNPANLPYSVTGNGLFYVRRCADGNYRIVKWVDKTYESIASPKSAIQRNTIEPQQQTSWGNIKAQFAR